jgi:hypothetical protein
MLLSRYSVASRLGHDCARSVLLVPSRCNDALGPWQWCQRYREQLKKDLLLASAVVMEMEGENL